MAIQVGPYVRYLYFCTCQHGWNAHTKGGRCYGALISAKTGMATGQDCKCKKFIFHHKEVA